MSFADAEPIDPLNEPPADDFEQEILANYGWGGLRGVRRYLRTPEPAKVLPAKRKRKLTSTEPAVDGRLIRRRTW